MNATIQGLIDYYEGFLSTIHAHGEDTYDVIGLGHEGHSTDKPLGNLEGLNRPDAFRNTRPLPSLQEQIDRKVDFVDQIRATYPAGTKLVLIGHSVGAYICQEVSRLSQCL
jgi:alpha-beta hydrolase superfamily lysophospholipase